MGHVCRSFHVLRQTSSSWSKNIPNLLLMQPSYQKIETKVGCQKHLLLSQCASNQQLSHNFPVKKHKVLLKKMRLTCSRNIPLWAFLISFTGVLSALGWIYDMGTLNVERAKTAKSLLEGNPKKILSKWMVQNTKECPNLQMTEEIFNTTDNLCVIWIRSENELIHMRNTVQKLKNIFDKLQLPFTITFCYSINDTTEDGKKLALGELIQEDHCHTCGSPNSVVFHKGTRKLNISTHNSTCSQQKPLLIDKENELCQILQEFYKPVSQQLNKENPSDNFSTSTSTVLPENVTHDTFHKKIVLESSPNHSVIVQMMEDGCFLCFLMRPFINTISKILKQNNCPVTVKRFAIDKNDFPVDCPVVRSTPCFVEFHGADTKQFAPKIWPEFKPQDLLNRLIKDFALPTSARTELDTALTLVHDRFQKFGLLTLWTYELDTLQKLHCHGIEKFIEKEPSDYSTVMRDLVRHDHSRRDDLTENIVYLEKAIDSVILDCMTFAKLIGPSKLEQVRKQNPSYFQLINEKLISENGNLSTFNDSKSITHNEDETITPVTTTPNTTENGNSSNPVTLSQMSEAQDTNALSSTNNNVTNSIDSTVQVCEMKDKNIEKDV